MFFRRRHEELLAATRAQADALEGVRHLLRHRPSVYDPAVPVRPLTDNEANVQYVTLVKADGSAAYDAGGGGSAPAAPREFPTVPLGSLHVTSRLINPATTTGLMSTVRQDSALSLSFTAAFSSHTARYFYYEVDFSDPFFVVAMVRMAGVTGSEQAQFNLVASLDDQSDWVYVYPFRVNDDSIEAYTVQRFHPGSAADPAIVGYEAFRIDARLELTTLVIADFS